MATITYKKGDLFTAAQDKTAILAHACNCKGVWGSGIAVDFKKKYPESFNDYKRLCDKHGKSLLGMGFYFWPRWCDYPKIGYLFTSYDYGKNKDSEADILKNTRRAVSSLISLAGENPNIHTPKINSGRFAVPWEKTEAIIVELIKDKTLSWTVWEL